MTLDKLAQSVSRSLNVSHKQDSSFRRLKILMNFKRWRKIHAGMEKNRKDQKIDIERIRAPISPLARYWSKTADFNVPTCICLPRLGDTFRLSPRSLAWHHKARIPVLSYCVVFMILRLALLVEHGLGADRTDGQTQRDRQTEGHVISLYGASVASRGKRSEVLAVAYAHLGDQTSTIATRRHSTQLYASCQNSCNQYSMHCITARSELRKVLFLAPSVCVLVVYEIISWTAERICAKFTRDVFDSSFWRLLRSRSNDKG